MIAERIYHWAKLQPGRAAVIWNDVSLSYLSFSNAIRLACDFFEQENLPVGGTAIVLVHSLLDAWILVIALRILGLNTICVRSNEKIESLWTKDAACVVTTETEAAACNLANIKSSGTKVVIVPSAVQSIRNSNDLLVLHNDRRPFGGHILYT